MAIKIGDYNMLSIARSTPHGFYVSDGDIEMLLPQKYIEPDMNIGDEIEVFVMHDSEDRLVAIRQEPYGTVGQFVALEVFSTTSFGAFMDWGLGEKHLLVPKNEQKKAMREGEVHVVYITLDPRTDRVVGIAKLGAFIDRDASDLRENQEVALLVYEETDLGYMCIIDQRYSGMIYKNEIYKRLYVGDSFTGYVKQVREDGKVDLLDRKMGYDGIVGQESVIIEKLRRSVGGTLPFNDDSSPESIQETFQMSKKTFKRLLGLLYKQGRIELTHRGIKLIKW